MTKEKRDYLIKVMDTYFMMYNTNKELYFHYYLEGLKVLKQLQNERM